MKRITQIISVISLFIAAATIVLNFRVLFGKSIFIGFSIFSTIKNGTFMGFIGNIIGLVVTAVAFAAMGWFGIRLTIFGKESARRPAFIAGICVAALALVSLLFSFTIGFSFGDLIMLAFPLLYVCFIIQSTKA